MDINKIKTVMEIKDCKFTTTEDVVAAAIRKAVASFSNPVHLYIEPEARTRWERNHPNEDWEGQPQSADELASYRIIARAVIESLPTQLCLSTEEVDMISGALSYERSNYPMSEESEQKSTDLQIKIEGS
jgi:hypothetical protein